jgi:hypothetical protein
MSFLRVLPRRALHFGGQVDFLRELRGFVLKPRNTAVTLSKFVTPTARGASSHEACGANSLAGSR